MTMATASEIIKNDQAHVIHPLHHSSEAAEPLVIVEGHGAVIKDIHGNEYIDGLAGLWNVSVGHGREELARAAFEQMKKLAYFSNYVGYVEHPRRRAGHQDREPLLPEHGRRLLHLRRRRGQRVRLQDRPLLLEGEGEAGQGQGHRPPERLPRRHPPGDERHRHGAVLEDVRAARARASSTSRRRTRTASRAPGRGRRWARRRPGSWRRRSCGRAPTRWRRSSPSRSSAAAACIVPPDDYFPRIREICTKHDVLFIADEVITGFCRTGQWFALTHWNVQPDIQSFAKAVTSGYAPLGGIVVIARHLRDHEHGQARGPVDARLHLLGAPHVLRGRSREHRDHGARAAVGALGQARDAPLPGAARAPEGAAGHRRRARRQGAASPPWSSSRTGRRRPGSRPTRRWGCGSAGTWRSAGFATRIRSYPVPGGTFSEQIFFSPPLVITEQQIDRVLETVRASIKAVVPA